MSQIIPNTLYRNTGIIKCCCQRMTIVMTFEKIFAILNIAFFTESFHCLLKSCFSVCPTISILKYIFLSLTFVFCNINLHQPIQSHRYRYAFIGSHFDLIYLYPGILPLKIIGVPLQCTYFTDPKPYSPQMQIHQPHFLWKSI